MVSSLGRVRSMPKIDARGARQKGKILSQKTVPTGHKRVKLSIGWGRSIDKSVHTLVAEAFDKPRPDGLECRHLDGDASNNVPSNLRWGTRAENVRDAVGHGTLWQIMVKECPSGHPLVWPNLYKRDIAMGTRSCKACARATVNARMLGRKPTQGERDEQYEIALRTGGVERGGRGAGHTKAAGIRSGDPDFIKSVGAEGVDLNGII